MLFAHDTEVALASAAAWSTPAAAARSCCPTRPRSTSSCRPGAGPAGRARDQAELDAVRRLRPRLERLWELTEDDAAELVNALLREANALPQLVKHDSWDYHLHATPTDAPLADRMAVEAAMAFTDVIRTGQLDRLRSCAAEDCDDVHVDLSKNRSRRFCSTSCSNRTNVAAYRTRQARQLAGH